MQEASPTKTINLSIALSKSYSGDTSPQEEDQPDHSDNPDNLDSGEEKQAHDEQELKLRKKEKNRNQKKKKKIKQVELQYDLSALFEVILCSRNTFDQNQEYAREMVLSFSGKHQKFFCILDHILKTHLDRIMEDFWCDIEEPEEIGEEGQRLITDYTNYYKLIILKFYRDLERLHEGNGEVVKLLTEFFEVSPDKDRQKKYSKEGLLMSEYMYLMQSDEHLREAVREWRSFYKKGIGLDDDPEETVLLNSSLYDQFYQTFQILESEQKKETISKVRKKRRQKGKAVSQSFEEECLHIIEKQAEEDFAHTRLLHKIQQLEPPEFMLHFCLTQDQLAPYKS